MAVAVCVFRHSELVWPFVRPQPWVDRSNIICQSRGKWAGQCLHRLFQGINDKLLFSTSHWKVKIPIFFYFAEQISFSSNYSSTCTNFPYFCFVKWENSFLPTRRTSSLSSSRAVGHVGVIFFSCGCFYLKVSCPLRSRCRQHITFRGGWWRRRSFFTHGQFTVGFFFFFGFKMSTDTNFFISQPLE